MIRRLIRWILNKDELEAIRNELRMLHVLLASEIERQQPKKHQPIQPIGRLGNK
jgi:hypothetical protein